MSLYIASLNSGSNGNCYYIGNQHEAVLIDAGISCRITEQRMDRLGLAFTKVRAVFITHEHTDHTGGVEVISRRYKLPVYLTAATYAHSRLEIDPGLLMPVQVYAPVQVGNLSVQAFPKRHDASEPVSFTISSGGVTVGVLTDIGSVCEHVLHNFKLCNAVFLETNYDEVMLEQGQYPVFLKNRIRGDQGHLSNRQALELFTRHKPPFLTHLLLSHLSRDNNNPQMVEDLFKKHAGETRISVASRYEESPVFCIESSDNPEHWVKVMTPPGHAFQGSLF